MITIKFLLKSHYIQKIIHFEVNYNYLCYAISKYFFVLQ